MGEERVDKVEDGRRGGGGEVEGGRRATAGAPESASVEGSKRGCGCERGRWCGRGCGGERMSEAAAGRRGHFLVETAMTTSKLALSVLVVLRMVDVPDTSRQIN